MQVDVEYHPVVLVFFRLPALQVPAVEQVNVNPSEPQLKSGMQTRPYVLRPYGQQATRDVAYPCPSTETVFVAAFHDVLLIGQRGRLPAANSNKHKAASNGGWKQVNDRPFALT